jgi:hypothetical protein
MFSIYPETVLQGMHYGYAVVLAERFGHSLQYHGGGITGFQSVLQRYPDVGLVIAILSNVDSGDDASSEAVAHMGPWVTDWPKSGLALIRISE